jgi:hypothetical protein
MFLTDELIKRARTHAISQRPRLIRLTFAARNRLKQAHEITLLNTFDANRSIAVHRIRKSTARIARRRKIANVFSIFLGDLGDLSELCG